jgi:SAM-dependent methyltransferase
MSRFYTRWKKQLIRSKLLSGLGKFPGYFRDWRRYSQMEGAESIRLADTYPCLFDKTSGTGIDSHYFYQHVWAMEKIIACKPALHVDIGSNVDFVGLLSTITKVQFVDIRPMQVNNLPNLESKYGSILELPYEDNSLESGSCQHVAEHIGLGRYGDPLDPLGTRKAAAELARCLKPGGSLYFSLPVGKPKLQFNAHRVHSPRQILEYFKDLKLREFSGSTDDKQFLRNTELSPFEQMRYACGMFLFTK